jgi:hypothetical protein
MITKVISAFPGTGKTFFHKNNQETTLDSDSSEFSWIKKGVRNPKFPDNYIEHIKKNLGKYEYIFVSSHKEVRDALVKEGIHFWLLYPSKECKDVYIQRYKDRKSPDAFIKLLDEKWDEWLTELDNQEDCTHIKLLLTDTITSALNWHADFKN